MGKPANDNLQHAFTIAKNEFGITPLLDPEGKFYFVHLVILRIHVMLFFFCDDWKLYGTLILLCLSVYPVLIHFARTRNFPKNLHSQRPADI